MVRSTRLRPDPGRAWHHRRVDVALLLLAMALVGGAAAVALGRVRGGLEAPTSTLPEQLLPSGPMAPQDVDDVHFALGLRGYRMDQVDAVLDRLALELRRRDAELDRLRGGDTDDHQGDRSDGDAAWQPERPDDPVDSTPDTASPDTASPDTASPDAPDRVAARHRQAATADDWRPRAPTPTDDGAV